MKITEYVAGHVFIRRVPEGWRAEDDGGAIVPGLTRPGAPTLHAPYRTGATPEDAALLCAADYETAARALLDAAEAIRADAGDMAGGGTEEAETP